MHPLYFFQLVNSRFHRKATQRMLHIAENLKKIDLVNSDRSEWENTSLLFQLSLIF